MRLVDPYLEASGVPFTHFQTSMFYNVGNILISSLLFLTGEISVLPRRQNLPGLGVRCLHFLVPSSRGTPRLKREPEFSFSNFVYS